MTYVMNTELEDNIKSALASNPALRDKILFLVAERDAYWKERVRETAYKASKDKEREDATMEEAIASAELSMDTPDTENRENSTSFGSGTNIYGDIDTLIREMFSYWDRIKESNPGSVASNDVKDPITMVIDYADSLRTSRDTYWKERVRKEVEGMRMTRIQWAGTTDEQKNALLAIFDAHNQALDTLLDNLK